MCPCWNAPSGGLNPRSAPGVDRVTWRQYHEDLVDNLRHADLLAILRKRVNDGRILELVEAWLETGIMDGKDLVFPEKGSPQRL